MKTKELFTDEPLFHSPSNDDDILFIDDHVEQDKITFEKNEGWKILIVDDEVEVHRVTKMVLDEIYFESRPLELISAFSGKEAEELLLLHDNIAVVLLDVVMEEEDSGLQVIKFIRDMQNNHLIRIILRTGQPGQAPEKHVILEYDINDYKAKTELTSDKLFTSIITALRSYKDLKTIEKANEEQKKWNEMLEDTVKQRTNSLRNLLNSIGQGFLSFNKKLEVDKEYSLQCLHLFKINIEHKHFPALIYPDDIQQQSFLSDLISSILEEEDPEMLEVYFPLLPTEIQMNSFYIEMKFKKINKEKMVVILTDVTEKRQLERKMDEEQQILKMIVRVVTNYNDFVTSVQDLKLFQSRIDHFLTEDTELATFLPEIHRELHTFKGTFSQLQLCYCPNYLHQLETKLLELQKEKDPFTIISYLADIKISDFLKKDLAILTSTLGINFFEKEMMIIINPEQLIELEHKVISMTSPPECQQLLAEIRKLRLKKIKHLLLPYNEYILHLGQKLGKYISPLYIEGGDTLVDEAQYRGLIKMLGHLFRNMLDHGMEPPDIRESQNKSSYGTISCYIKKSDKELIIEISDDGMGISLDTLRDQVIAHNLMTEEQAANARPEQLFPYIFKDGVSTQSQFSTISGRGLGLSALKKEVESMGGSITVESIPKLGTTFTIRIPNEEQCLNSGKE